MTVRFPMATHCVAVLVILFAARGLVADESSSDSGDTKSPRFVSIGQLASVPSDDGEAIQYVLLDEDGEILSRLKPTAELNLAEHLGEELAVTARTLVDGDVPLLLAERITLFGERSQDPDTDTSGHDVALTVYEEELVPSPGVMDPNGVTISPFVGEPIEFRRPITQAPYVGGSCPECGNLAGGAFARCPCGPPGRLWIRSDLLMWWRKGMDVPPLVTTSPFGTPLADAGVLGQSGTSIAYGNNELLRDGRAGGRYRLGAWLDECQWIGLEAEFLFLFDENDHFNNTEIGELILARPYFDTLLQVQASEIVQYPGVAVGTIQVDSETRLWSVGPRFRINLACEDLSARNTYWARGASYRLDAILGYRYFRLEDRFRVRDRRSTLDPLNQVVREVRDAFDSSNDFHGGDIGILWERYRGPWSLELIGRIGFGNNHQKVRIGGSTTTSMGGVPTTVPVGFLASASNIGSYSRDRFTTIPEFSASFGYAVGPRIRLSCGYTFLYWNRVVRAGNQVNLNIGPASPTFAFHETSFWAQGFNAGLDYHW